MLDAGITIFTGTIPVTVTRDEIGDDILAGCSFIGDAPLTASVFVVNGTCCRRQFE